MELYQRALNVLYRLYYISQILRYTVAMEMIGFIVYLTLGILLGYLYPR